MSGSETVMTSNNTNREAFNGGVASATAQQGNNSSNMQFDLAYTATDATPPPPAAYKQPPMVPVGGVEAHSSAAVAPPQPPLQGQQAGGGLAAINNNNNSGSETVKRKRGRPRKYGTDGSNMSLSLLSSPPPQPQAPSASSVPPQAPTPITQPTSSSSAAAAAATGAGVPLKKARGRPPGSTNKKHNFNHPLGSAGFGFTPHVITVKAGEDVSSKIMSLSHHGTRAVCILSANGSISNVTLRQPATSGGTVTYEGRFEILSLSGSFLLSENGGQRSRTGGLSVSLSGPDGRVLGGGVAGPLTAASPLQVVVGSFIPDGRKESRSGFQMEPSSVPTNLPSGSPVTGPSSPQSRGTLSESPGAPGSPLNQSTGACNNHNAHGMSSNPWK